MHLTVITAEEVANRRRWIEKLAQLGGNFGADSLHLEQMIFQEIATTGVFTLIGHLRLCGAIPEQYAHDSSEEKLYSKYTDIVIHAAFTMMGFKSLVLRERADTADVECMSDDYSFVADAKAFRLSRTAKNQKDFKIQAMDGWKRGKPFAMVVCPVYQLPSRSSQIYQQAAARSVYIGTYTHLAVLVRYAHYHGQHRSLNLLHEVFKAVEAMIPLKDAATYWQTANRAFLNLEGDIRDIWREEKIASVESVQVAKNEALEHLVQERERIIGLSREEAILEVLRSAKLDTRIQAVTSITHNNLLEFEG